MSYRNNYNLVYLKGTNKLIFADIGSSVFAFHGM
jgi:hypothetical protein